MGQIGVRLLPLIMKGGLVVIIEALSYAKALVRILGCISLRDTECDCTIVSSNGNIVLCSSWCGLT